MLQRKAATPFKGNSYSFFSINIRRIPTAKSDKALSKTEGKSIFLSALFDFFFLLITSYFLLFLIY